MAYFLVMGGLALSVCFTLGWGLWRIARWPIGRLVRRRPPTGRAATPSRRGGGGRRASTPRSRPRGPTRALARLYGAWPLAVLAWLLYGGARLAAHGMAARPRRAPGEFLALVEALGWAATGLAGLAVVGLLAAWWCRRSR